MSNDSVEVVEGVREVNVSSVTKKDLLLVAGAVLCGCLVDILHGTLLKQLQESNESAMWRIVALETKVFRLPNEHYITDQYIDVSAQEDDLAVPSDDVPNKVVDKVVVDDSGDTTTE